MLSNSKNLSQKAIKAKIVKSPLRQIGGKSKVAEYIVSKFPSGIKTYVEPMVGGGSVFLAARSLGVADNYVISDAFGHLYCFWLIAQNKNQLLRDVLHQMHDDGAEDVNELKRMFYEARNTKKLNQFEAACYLFFLSRVSFSGSILKGGFSPSAALDRFTKSSIDRIASLEKMLVNVHVSNRKVEDSLLAWSMSGRKDVFLYLDPPYIGQDKLYSCTVDHKKLAALLKETPHKFLLSYNDCELVRKRYRWANIQSFSMKYGATNAGGNTCVTGGELLISNY